MGGTLIMSQKERERKVVLEQLFRGHCSRSEASRRLSVSERQLKRIIARYKAFGDLGLIHKSRGKRSNRITPPDKKKKILSLYREKYLDFGPTFASEKLEEDDGIKVHPETLRLWLKAEGLWIRHRKRKPYRQRRPRRLRFGELLQLDGSIHCWFEGIEQHQCLMNLVDDATGKSLALLDHGETTHAALSLLKWWIEEMGIPQAIYVDLKSVYVSPKSLKQKEENGEPIVEAEWLTHFSKACKKLGIEVIKAYSPQAKGRVERKHAVYQDRFVKELKLKQINTIEEANTFLRTGFLNKLNDKFSYPPGESDDAHIALSSSDDLNQILCWEFTRQVKNDWTVQYANQHYQIEKTLGVEVRPKQKIQVRLHLDGSISLWRGDFPLVFHLIEGRKKRSDRFQKLKGYDTHQRSQVSRQNKHRTPWSQYHPGWLSSDSAQEAV